MVVARVYKFACCFVGGEKRYRWEMLRIRVLEKFSQNLSELLKIVGTVRCFLDETDYAAKGRRSAETESDFGRRMRLGMRPRARNCECQALVVLRFSRKATLGASDCRIIKWSRRSDRSIQCGRR